MSALQNYLSVNKSVLKKSNIQCKTKLILPLDFTIDSAQNSTDSDARNAHTHRVAYGGRFACDYGGRFTCAARAYMPGWYMT